MSYSFGAMLISAHPYIVAVDCVFQSVCLEAQCAKQVWLLQTAARVWDALLQEGPKVLFRVALAILKTNEAVLLKQDNVGLLLRELRHAVQHLHDRDKLMKVQIWCCLYTAPWIPLF